MSSILRWALESSTVPSVIFLGEVHDDRSQRKSVVEKVKHFKPDVLVHELAYGDKALTVDVLEDRIANAGKDELCDPRLNLDVYELALELKIPLIGCDLESKEKFTAKQFQKREQHMASVIRKVSTEGYKRVAVVVGDTHLRTSAPEELGGESAITTGLYEDNLGYGDVEVVRAPKNKREVE